VKAEEPIWRDETRRDECKEETVELEVELRWKESRRRTSVIDTTMSKQPFLTPSKSIF